MGKVEVGQPVMITVDAYPNQQFFGKVVRIATKGVSTSNVVTFEVKIEVLGRNKHLLKPEMTANVEIIAGEREKALLVPVEAVSRKMGKMIAQVVKPDKTIEEREIKVGISDGVNQEVLSGLNLGETVLVRKGELESRWRSGSSTQQRRQMPFGSMMMPPGPGRRSGR
ncbi:MAG: HlyD family secretion protein [Candidatus Sumerlaeia bacterium]|nr:HlyD family secretion protein [Candidatus Sumerlaeia bacterium]